MKTKIILLMIPFFFLITGMGGCEEKINVTDLLHTWKFQGFGNTNDNYFEKATPSDCDECYVLTFSEDGAFSGHSTTNGFSGEYTVDGKDIKIIDFIATEIYELGNGGKYLEKMNQIQRYEIIGNKLKLYYNQEQNYLLFNLLN